MIWAKAGLLCERHNKNPWKPHFQRCGHIAERTACAALRRKFRLDMDRQADLGGHSMAGTGR